MCFLSEEVCGRKWKGLRDTHLKEKRKETERKSGSAAGSAKSWKYFAVLSFLDPFVTPRETSSNMGRVVEEDRTAEYKDKVSDTAAGPLGIDIGGWLTGERERERETLTHTQGKYFLYR